MHAPSLPEVIAHPDARLHPADRSRRTFLKEVGAATGALLFAQAAGRAAAASGPDWRKQIGLELFTVRDLLRQDYDCDSDTGGRARKMPVGAAFLEAPLP